MEGNSRRTSNSLELFKPFQVRWGLAGDGAGEESEAHIRTFLRMAQPLHQQVFGGCCEHSQFIPWALVCASLIRRTRPDGLLGLQSHCGGLPGSGHTVEETVSPCSQERRSQGPHLPEGWNLGGLTKNQAILVSALVWGGELSSEPKAGLGTQRNKDKLDIQHPTQEHPDGDSDFLFHFLFSLQREHGGGD